jgi:hypothetical protein
MDSKQFLTWIGWILLALGVLGFIWPNVGGAYLYFDSVENWAHTLLGVVALVIAYGVKDMQTLKWVATVYGTVALVIGVWGFLVAGNSEPNFYGVANLENPLDNLVHLIIGVWGLWAAWWK